MSDEKVRSHGTEANERKLSMEWYSNRIKEIFEGLQNEAEKSLIQGGQLNLPPRPEDRNYLYNYYLELPYRVVDVFAEHYLQYKNEGRSDAKEPMQDRLNLRRMEYLKLLNLIDALILRICDYNIDRSVFRFGFNTKRARGAIIWLVCSQVKAEMLDAQDINRLMTFYRVQIERLFRLRNHQLEEGAFYDQSDIDRKFDEVRHSLSIDSSNKGDRSSWRKTMQSALKIFKEKMQALINQVFDVYDVLSVYRDYLTEIDLLADSDSVLALDRAIVLARAVKQIFLEQFAAYTKIPELNLGHSEFPGAHFSRSDMGKGNFINSNFKYVQMDNANASESDFSICNFTRANANGATLHNCNFSYSNLSGINLENASLKSSLLNAVIFHDALLDESINFAEELSEIPFRKRHPQAAACRQSYERRAEQIAKKRDKEEARAENRERITDIPYRLPENMRAMRDQERWEKWRYLSLENGEEALELFLTGRKILNDFRSTLMLGSDENEKYVFQNPDDSSKDKTISRSLWNLTIAAKDDYLPGLILRRIEEDEEGIPQLTIPTTENGLDASKTVFQAVYEEAAKRLDKLREECREKIIGPGLLRWLRKAERDEKPGERHERFMRFGQICLEPASLVGASIIDCAIPEVDLSHIDMRNASFAESDLSECVGHYIKAETCNFEKANMNSAEFYRANFGKATFSGANCIGTLFVDCNMQGIDMSGARAINCYVINTGRVEKEDADKEEIKRGLPFLAQMLCSLPAGDNILENITEDIDDEDFPEERITLKESNWNDAVASNSIFMGMVMDRTQCNRADLHNFMIFNCMARWSSFTSVDMSFGMLMASSFHQSSFENATFSKAHLFGCEFSGCRMKNSVIIGARADKVVFHDVDLSGVNFSRTAFYNCIFRDCNFNGINISNARFVHCTFYEVSFDNCVGLRNAKFFECIFSKQPTETGVLQLCSTDNSQGKLADHTSLCGFTFYSNCKNF